MSEIETREGVDLDALRTELAEATREEVCPWCEGALMDMSRHCMANCRDGVVRWTSANVLRSVKFWFDAQTEDIEQLRAELRAARTPAQTQTFKDGFAAGRDAERADVLAYLTGGSHRFLTHYLQWDAETSDHGKAFAWSINAGEHHAIALPQDPALKEPS